VKFRIIALIFLLIRLAVGNLYAQQEQQHFPFSQHENDKYFYIPAVAGIASSYEMQSAAHVQALSDTASWQAYFFSAYGPLNYFPVGVGFSASHIRTGLYVQNSIQLTGACSFKSGSSQYAFAASIGGLEYDFSGWGLPAGMPGDTLADKTRYLPDVGLSFYMTRDIFYVGAAIQHIGNMSLKVTPNGEYMTGELLQQIYFLAGACVDVSGQVALEPSLLIGCTKDDFAGSLSLTMNFEDWLWIGGSYKSTGKAGVIVGGQLAEKYYLSYAYEHPLTSSTKYGIHELVLGVRLASLRGGRR
jgi:type IX secretion system PorP/SprF family membrane protein